MCVSLWLLCFSLWLFCFPFWSFFVSLLSYFVSLCGSLYFFVVVIVFLFCNPFAVLCGLFVCLCSHFHFHHSLCCRYVSLCGRMGLFIVSMCLTEWHFAGEVQGGHWPFRPLGLGLVVSFSNSFRGLRVIKLEVFVMHNLISSCRPGIASMQHSQRFITVSIFTTCIYHVSSCRGVIMAFVWPLQSSVCFQLYFYERHFNKGLACSMMKLWEKQKFQGFIFSYTNKAIKWK